MHYYEDSPRLPMEVQTDSQLGCGWVILEIGPGKTHLPVDTETGI